MKKKPRGRPDKRKEALSLILKSVKRFGIAVNANIVKKDIERIEKKRFDYKTVKKYLDELVKKKKIKSKKIYGKMHYYVPK